jgi:hypothetical protein
VIECSYNVQSCSAASNQVTVETSKSLSHRDRMRRVVLLCCAVARNVAYYRAGWVAEVQPLLSRRHPNTSFWRQVNGNFFDIAVLDCCKLFGDLNETPLKRVGKHHWRRVASNPDDFETRLHAQLSTDSAGFTEVIRKIRDYRDRFVAHLDDELKMFPPELDTARKAVTFYHRHIVECEARPGELAALPSVDEFARGDDQCTQEAVGIFRKNL